MASWFIVLCNCGHGGQPGAHIFDCCMESVFGRWKLSNNLKRYKDSGVFWTCEFRIKCLLPTLLHPSRRLPPRSNLPQFLHPAPSLPPCRCQLIINMYMLWSCSLQAPLLYNLIVCCEEYIFTEAVYTVAVAYISKIVACVTLHQL